MDFYNIFANKIFYNWNIEIPHEEYFLEYLQREYSNKFYYIDQCPFSVGKKHEQIDMFFQEVLEKSLKKDEFSKLEVKYQSIMLKIWLYNTVYISSNIKEVCINKKNKKIDKKHLANYENIIKRNKFDENNSIEDRKILELFVQLGTRDLINVIFYFQEYEMIIVPLWSCYAVYFNNLSIIDTVEKIVNTEGMYLRKTIEKTI